MYQVQNNALSIICHELLIKYRQKNDSIIEREHALVKIKVNPVKRSEILQIITAAEARILDSTGHYWTLEVTGSTSAVSSAISLLSEYDIIESIRTGRIALERPHIRSWL